MTDEMAVEFEMSLEELDEFIKRLPAILKELEQYIIDSTFAEAKSANYPEVINVELIK